MKKLLSTALMSLALALTLGFGATALAATDAYAATNNGNLKVLNQTTNLYDSPSKSSDSKKGYAGTEVKVLGTTGSWSKIRLTEGSSKTRYVKTSMLDDLVLNVLGDHASVFAKPSTDSKVVGTLYWATPVTILSTHKRDKEVFAKVEQDGIEGYVVLKTRSGKMKLGATNIKTLEDTAVAYAKPSTSCDDNRTLYKLFRPKVYATYGKWAKVQTARKTAYMCTSDLTAMSYNVAGAYYDTVEDLKNGNSSGGTNETEVECIAIDKNLGLMQVKIGGKARFMRTASITDDPYVTTKYIQTASPRVYEFASSFSKRADRYSFNDKVQYAGKSHKVKSGWYLALEAGSDIVFVFQPKGVDLLGKEFKYDYSDCIKNPMQQAIVDESLRIALHTKTYYSNSLRGSVSENGVERWDCSGFAMYVLCEAVRDYAKEPEWTISETSTSYVSSTNKARNLALTKHCLIGSSKYPTKVVWTKGKNKASELYKNLQCGDLVFFRMSPYNKCGKHGKVDKCPDHVGIYLGHGTFAQATARFGTVCITSISEDYTPEKCLLKAVRYIPSMDYLKSIGKKVV